MKAKTDKSSIIEKCRRLTLGFYNVPFHDCFQEVHIQTMPVPELKQNIGKSEKNLQTLYLYTLEHYHDRLSH
jgi:hypothetical protein